MNKVIEPGSTIGIIGGGQLGRMMAFSAHERGYHVGVLDPAQNCSTAQVADWHIEANYDDAEALNQLAERSDILTYEFENVDATTIENVLDKVSVPQGTELLLITQNRLREKEFLKSAGIPIADFAKVETEKDLKEAVTTIGYPSVLKTIRGGYDGKGQTVLKSDKDLKEAVQLLDNGTCVLEKWITFEKEVSVMVARNNRGDISIFPTAENIHFNNILVKSIVPARVEASVHDKIEKIAQTIAEELNLIGTLGIEMFLTEENQIYANELAPRPHNSGHYSIEACSDSQFDQHIRAICGHPLAKVELLKAAVMINFLGEHYEKALKLNESKPAWHVHEYGKDQVKVGRKMGHVTVLTDNIEDTLKEIDDTEVWK